MFCFCFAISVMVEHTNFVIEGNHCLFQVFLGRPFFWIIPIPTLVILPSLVLSHFYLLIFFFSSQASSWFRFLIRFLNLLFGIFLIPTLVLLLSLVLYYLLFLFFFFFSCASSWCLFLIRFLIFLFCFTSKDPFGWLFFGDWGVYCIISFGHRGVFYISPLVLTLCFLCFNFSSLDL